MPEKNARLCFLSIVQHVLKCLAEQTREGQREGKTLTHSTALDLCECHSALLGNKQQHSFQKLTLSSWINTQNKSQLPQDTSLTSELGDKVHSSEIKLTFLNHAR